MMRGVSAAVAAAGLAVGLSACSSGSNSISAQANKGDDKGYVAGDGTVEQLAAAKRGKPIDLSGKTVDGKAWSLADAKGKVVVLNVWGSWCGPCQAEAADLQKAWTTFKPKGNVVMMGMDYRESATAGAAYLASKGITYPSLADDGGRSVLALGGAVSATPTTLVLDAQHRIAARVSGQVDTTTLVGMVDDVLKESS